MCELMELEPAGVWVESKRKARKLHRCDCCLGRIEKGSFYFKHFSVLGGYATSEKICEGCYGDRAEFAAEHNSLVPTPSYFREMLNECIYEDRKYSQPWRLIRMRIHKRSKTWSAQT